MVEFAQDGDLKRSYDSCVVDYEAKLYYAKAFKQNSLTLQEFDVTGALTGNSLEINMEVRPVLKTPSLGFFINYDHVELCLITKSIRRQFTFGLSATNHATKVVRLSSDKASFEPDLIRVNNMRFIPQFIRQFFSRNKTAPDWKGEKSFVLTPNFAILNEKLLHIDGVIGSVDRKTKKVLLDNKQLDDSLMRASIRKLGFEL